MAYISGRIASPQQQTNNTRMIKHLCTVWFRPFGVPDICCILVVTNWKTATHMSHLHAHIVQWPPSTSIWYNPTELPTIQWTHPTATHPPPRHPANHLQLICRWFIKSSTTQGSRNLATTHGKPTHWWWCHLRSNITTPGQITDRCKSGRHPSLDIQLGLHTNVYDSMLATQCVVNITHHPKQKNQKPLQKPQLICFCCIQKRTHTQ